MKGVVGTYTDIKAKTDNLNAATLHLWTDGVTERLTDFIQNKLNNKKYCLPVIEGYEQYYEDTDLETAVELDETWFELDISMLNHIFQVSTYTESFTMRYVDCYVLGGRGKTRLWEGDAYDAIGQWTDLDVQIRLNEMFPNG